MNERVNHNDVIYTEYIPSNEKNYISTSNLKKKKKKKKKFKKKKK